LAVFLVLGLNDGLVNPSSGQTRDSFSGQLTTQGYCEYGCGALRVSPPPPPNQSLPGGENVSFHWTDETGGSVSLWVRGPGPHASTVNDCWWSNKTSGACSFTPTGGLYSFYASNVYVPEGPQVVNYTGSYLT
jgi:hypothetical protein